MPLVIEHSRFDCPARHVDDGNPLTGNFADYGVIPPFEGDGNPTADLVFTRDDGWVVPFHCIVIADGSRDIPIGADVEFELMCKLGRYEAAHITST